MLLHEQNKMLSALSQSPGLRHCFAMTALRPLPHLALPLAHIEFKLSYVLLESIQQLQNIHESCLLELHGSNCASASASGR